MKMEQRIWIQRGGKQRGQEGRGGREGWRGDAQEVIK